ncbi:probable cytochrome P450 313a4 [Contarinia nasturtii]|uniref:probable cytochrome P450 313a4 n=1 Tax=Contarinia nasturtii TaxID=265458 RepID=UPI0012D3D856|nr:probable cytochrome P450 313a4 [Contarinia nasturtii]XP_031637233.1 probable cytochrome P450 313a4 [Contarinia nasturtii]
MLVLIVFFITFATYLLWNRRHLYLLSWQLPGPIAIPLIGNGYSIANPHKLSPYLDEVTKKYGSPIRLWFGPEMVVFISDAENAEIVLKSKDCLNKPQIFYKIVRDAMQVDGSFTLKAEKWKYHRRLLSPSVNLSKVSAHLPIFNQHIQKSIANLPINGDFIDILPYLSTCKIAMFAEAALGSEIEKNVKQKYLQQFAQGLEIVGKRILDPLLHIDFIWNLTESAKKLREYSCFGRTLFQKILKEKVQTGSESHSFLERLLDISNENTNFTHENVIAETATILTGATDTSSAASAFVAVMLAMHPEYQEKVFQEILMVMPYKDAELTQTDLDKLEFTELCIRETLRLFPTVPIIGRVTSKPVKLNNNIEVPVGVPIMLGLRQIHIREEYYGSTAKVYNPYRFMDENVKNLPGGAYIPFSYGPRNCFGYSYAKVSVKCCIVHLIRNYRLTTIYKNIEELKPVLSISMRLINKHMIKLERRE